MKKISILAFALMLPLVSNAQTSVFRCEVDGRVVWSDQPCKTKGKVVKVRKLSTDSASTPKSEPAKPKS
ncbi:DUF4124 domain-containing protein [Undibacterium sp. TS12]|uniref:DUF4124 domain-containing protein n=1 Tax=Undibacterium sp. TS12 TaxID=2908202 RepID=UPI001F4CAE41|nr:DUF4124 domain-containing protein [Undibacterium sp. TS12]MCH8621196.1 DUF4124 domain-containing protein [Undibacterium sp. TS12]